MKQYDSYKDSGIEWIGKIPSHWEIKRIRHVASIFGRIGYRGYTVSDLVHDGNGAITISPSNMKDSEMDFSDCTYLAWDKYEESPEIKVFEGDILFVKTGSTYGKSTLVRNLPKEATINPQIVILKDILCNNVFLWYSIKSPFIQLQIEETVVGGTIPTISQSKIINYIFPSPPLAEQAAIATYLDRKTSEIDALIADKKRLVELYEEEKLAIINQAVTKGINPNVKMKDSGVEWLGAIPEHWEVRKLKYVLCHKLMYGANEATNEACRNNPRYIRITDFDKSGKLRDDTYQSLSPEIANDYLLSEGDILFARSGATVGKTFQFKNYEGKACFAGYLIKATPSPEVIESDFLYYYTKSGAYENWKESIFNQATIQNIGADKYAVLGIPMPLDIQEQQSIVQHIEAECSDIDTKISKTNKLIKLLTEYRTALISEVVTGKVKVI